jgi:hypothetical protein
VREGEIGVRASSGPGEAGEEAGCVNERRGTVSGWRESWPCCLASMSFGERRRPLSWTPPSLLRPGQAREGEKSGPGHNVGARRRGSVEPARPRVRLQGTPHARQRGSGRARPFNGRRGRQHLARPGLA